MFSSVRKVVVHQAFAKSGFSSPWIGRLYYMNRRFWATVTNTFAGHCIKCRSPPDASLRVLESQPTNSNRQDTVKSDFELALRVWVTFNGKGDHERVGCATISARSLLAVKYN
jgi:hypothetical protein